MINELHMWQENDCLQCLQQLNVMNVTSFSSISFWSNSKFAPKLWSSEKSIEKDKFKVPPQGVDQLLHVNQLWGVDTYYFFVHFQTFFVHFRRKITEKGLKWTKQLKKNISTRFRVHAAWCTHAMGVPQCLCPLSLSIMLFALHLVIFTQQPIKL